MILEKKLLPFAKKCEETLLGIIVQEDNAPPHIHHHQATVYNLWEIVKLLWPSNSPDLNAIEPAWYWLKRETTKRGVTSRVGHVTTLTTTPIYETSITAKSQPHG